MAENAQDRQLPASQRKIRKARDDGQVARSRDFGHFVALGLGTGLAATLMPALSERAGRILGAGLRFDAAQLAQSDAMTRRLAELGLEMTLLLLPLFGLVLLAAVVSSVVAGGWNFTLKPLTPDFAKINPVTGLGRLLSGHQLTDTLKASGLALVLGAVASAYLMRHWMQHAELLAMPLPAALTAGGELILGGLLPVAAVLGLFALVDVPLQRMLLMRRLRMSTEELKQEFKELEGNSEVKAKVRLRMREMANRRMLAAVPRADLVVMNPSHYAVALRYDEATMAAPRVVAKGADLLAMRIRDIAREAKVPVLQAPPLARALYAHTELDQEIPARLFGAVAQVLAWVFQLRQALAAGRPLVAPPPDPEVPPELDPAHAEYRRPGAGA